MNLIPMCFPKVFSPSVGGWGWYFPGSQYVLTMFPLSSQWVFTMPSSSQCFPQHVLHSTSLLSHMLWQMLSSFHVWIWWAKGEELCISKYNLLRWGAYIVSFFLSGVPIKLAHCRKIIINNNQIRLNLRGTSSN